MPAQKEGFGVSGHSANFIWLTLTKPHLQWHSGTLKYIRLEKSDKQNRTCYQTTTSGGLGKGSIKNILSTSFRVSNTVQKMAPGSQ